MKGNDARFVLDERYRSFEVLCAYFPSTCDILRNSRKDEMQLRSSRLLGGFPDVQSEKRTLNHAVSSATSAEQIVTFKNERDLDLSASIEQNPSFFSSSKSARRYHLRSRTGETSSKQLPKDPTALSKRSKLSVLKSIKRHTGVRAPPANELRICPICVEHKMR